MNCSCAQHEDLVEITISYSEFIRNFEEVERASWVSLTKCPICHQMWRVDIWDKYQVLYAVKLLSVHGWEEFDIKDMIKKKMIQNRGGLDQVECIWVDCAHKRVKGSAYCIDHLYETGARS